MDEIAWRSPSTDSTLGSKYCFTALRQHENWCTSLHVAFLILWVSRKKTHKNHIAWFGDSSMLSFHPRITHCLFGFGKTHGDVGNLLSSQVQPNTSLEALWSIWSHFVAKTAAASFLLPVIAAALFRSLFIRVDCRVTDDSSGLVLSPPETGDCIGGWPYAHVLELELSNCSYA